MNLKFLASLAFAAAIAGCSKKEEASAPLTPPPVASAPASPAMADQTGLKSLPLETAVTNAQGAVAKAAATVAASADTMMARVTNAGPISSVPSNATAQNAMSALGGVIAPAAQNPSATPAAVGKPPMQSSSPLSLADLSTDQVTQGLKEALGKGLQHAITSLGQPGGFMTNVTVKIPLPDKLQSVEKTLRALGQGQLADQCIATMNQAAEQAVPAAADVFANSLKSMSVDDAKGILNGPADAATQFFRHSTEAELTQKFLPIVQQAMTKCGATAAYEQVLDKAKVASPFFSNPSLDLNAYVTGKTMDGLFKMVADEEKRIRENPVARSTDMLKSVFGALKK